jgi:hypothetical protein
MSELSRIAAAMDASLLSIRDALVEKMWECPEVRLTLTSTGVKL